MLVLHGGSHATHATHAMHACRRWGRRIRAPCAAPRRATPLQASKPPSGGEGSDEQSGNGGATGAAADPHHLRTRLAPSVDIRTAERCTPKLMGHHCPSWPTGVCSPSWLTAPCNPGKGHVPRSFGLSRPDAVYGLRKPACCTAMAKIHLCRRLRWMLDRGRSLAGRRAPLASRGALAASPRQSPPRTAWGFMAEPHRVPGGGSKRGLRGAQGPRPTSLDTTRAYSPSTLRERAHKTE